MSGEILNCILKWVTTVIATALYPTFSVLCIVAAIKLKKEQDLAPMIFMIVGAIFFLSLYYSFISDMWFN
jgi:uncharacterized membrane protein YeaQ/YmgE (transglycosylase-associated protein family)